MKNTQITALAFLLIGLILGYFISTTLVQGNNHNQKMNRMSSMGGHMMPDGTTMGGGMADMMTGMMAGLQGKTGDDFDKAFLSEMVMHHQGAVTMAEMVLSTSKRPELLQLARDIITAQTKEITMMQNWQ